MLSLGSIFQLLKNVQPATQDVLKHHYLLPCGGVCNRAVNTSNSGSGGPGGSSLERRVVLRQEIILHSVSLHPGVLRGTGDDLMVGNPALDLHPVQGVVSNTPRHASCYGNRYKLRRSGPLARVRLYLPYLSFPERKKFNSVLLLGLRQ